MKKRIKQPDKLADLRIRAEEVLHKFNTASHDLTPEDARILIEELRIHQIELEMQNEELRKAQQELEKLRSKYSELYNFAPIGYFTFDAHGIITEVNLTGAELVGVERSKLISSPFSLYVAPESREMYHKHLADVSRFPKRLTIEIKIIRKNNEPFYAQVESIAILDDSGKVNQFHTVITDITERKRIDDAHLFLVQCGYLYPKEDFFESLARYLAQNLGMDYVCIDRLLNDELTAQTVAIYYDGKFEDNVKYTLKDTPCGDVIGKDVCCFPKDVRHLFPQDAVLQEMKAESYVGTTLWSFHGKPIGLIAVIGRKPLVNQQLTASLLKLVSVRAAGELERKWAEEALHESEEKFRAFMESANEFMIILDKDFNFSYVNESMMKTFEYSHDELLGAHFTLVLRKEEVDTNFQGRFREFLETGRLILEDSWVTKYGKEVHGEIGAVAIYDENGGFCGARIVFHDITERKRAEEEVSRIFDLTPDLLCVASPDGRFIKINLQWEKVLGFTTEEIMQLGYSKLIHPDDVEKTAHEIERQLGGSSTANFVNRYRCKDGSYKLLEWYATPTDTGLLYAAARDITERKRLEEQLEIRQRMDSLGTLAGGIAHDFNNLLTGIMGNIDMLNLEPEGFSELQKEYLTNAMTSCERAATLIRQFQTLSRGSVTQKISVDVYEIVSEVFNLLGKTTDRLIEKKIDFQPGDFQVTADPSELNQVFLNLGMNAVQAIEERGVKPGDYISVRAEDYTIRGIDIIQLPEREYVHILFKDNGIGMTDEVRRKAFDPLFTTKEKGKQKGQGLGLAMVYNIVTRKHGGYITIESTTGKGTTFHIYLPKASAEGGVLPEKIKEIAGGNETVLIIDDEEMIVNLAKNVLEEYGYRILTASDGRQGLDMYIEKMDSINLVLLDLTMPEMSGKMVLEEMLLINPFARIIISSGHSEEETREGILSAAKGYVQKPYKMKNLVQTVRTVLDS